MKLDDRPALDPRTIPRSLRKWLFVLDIAHIAMLLYIAVHLIALSSLSSKVYACGVWRALWPITVLVLLVVPIPLGRFLSERRASTGFPIGLRWALSIAVVVGGITIGWQLSRVRARCTDQCARIIGKMTSERQKIPDIESAIESIDATDPLGVQMLEELWAQVIDKALEDSAHNRRADEPEGSAAISCRGLVPDALAVRDADKPYPSTSASCDRLAAEKCVEKRLHLGACERVRATCDPTRADNEQRLERAAEQMARVCNPRSELPRLGSYQSRSELAAAKSALAVAPGARRWCSSTQPAVLAQRIKQSNETLESLEREYNDAGQSCWKSMQATLTVAESEKRAALSRACDIESVPSRLKKCLKERFLDEAERNESFDDIRASAAYKSCDPS